MRRSLRNLFLIGVLTALLTPLGCGDDPEDPVNNFPPDEDMGVDLDGGIPDGGDNNGGDDGGANNGMPDGGEEDMYVDPNLGCENIQMMASPIESQIITDDFDEAFTAGEASCADDIAEADTTGVKIYRFAPDITTEIDIVVDGVPKLTGEFEIPPDPVVELRKGACNETGEIVSCSDERRQSFVLDAGEVYFLVFNGKLDSGGLEVDLDAQQRICELGAVACVNGQIEQCKQGIEIETFACMQDTCNDQDSCAGDICDTALEVNLNTDGTVTTIQANRGAYESSWNALDREGCSLDAGPAGPTPNADMFLSLPGLPGDQKLVIDAAQSDGTFAFYILEDCSAEACLAAGDFDFTNENRMEWEIPTGGGDFVLIVESLGLTERDLNLDLSIIP